MAVLSLLTTLRVKTTECCNCGCVVAMSEDMYDKRLEDHKWFYCPNGHQQHFTDESRAERAERELRDERLRHQRTLARANEAEQQRDRLKKRVKAGVCPCCKRTFKQLAAHMKHQHPDWPKK